MRIANRHPLGFSAPRSAFRVPRSAFTLVELLVAVALTIAIMGIIGWAMGRTVDTFRNLNGIASMQNKLVAVQAVMKRDLSAEKFGGRYNPATGGLYVGDQRLDLTGWRPPEEGFFCLTHASGGPNYLFAGNDSDGVPSTGFVDQTLHFTARYSGKREEDYFYSLAPSGLITTLTNPTPPFIAPDFQRIFPPPNNNSGMLATEWGEVMYFLAPSAGAGGYTNGSAGTPLYTLYRRYRSLLPSTVTSLPVWSAGNQLSFPNVACNQSANGLVNSGPANTGGAAPDPGIGNRSNRLALTLLGPGWRAPTFAEMFTTNDMRAGDDVLCTDVISFEVLAFWTNGSASVVGENMTPVDGLFSALPASPRLPNVYNGSRRCFDTWSQAEGANMNWDDPTSFNAVNGTAAFTACDRPPLRIRLTTLQIRIRVWDFNTQQTRQITFVQDI